MTTKKSNTRCTHCGCGLRRRASRLARNGGNAFCSHECFVRLHEHKLPDAILNLCTRSPSGCLEFQGFIDPGGYGRFCHKRRSKSAHRLLWESMRGAIPRGLFVCHRCDNRRCCEIEHLFLGTAADNVRDMIEKGRARYEVGSARYCAKLTEDRVRLVLAGRREGKTVAQLAREFGLTRTPIDRIVRGTAWKHVSREAM